MALACTIVYAFLALVNLLGFLMARHDKRTAGRSGRARKRDRVPERLFHLAAMVGGWPGTALAFKVYRHKTRKVRFLVAFWAFAVLGTLALAGWLWALDCLGPLAR